MTGHTFAKIDGDYKYLVKMTMDSVTAENVERIMQEKAAAEQALAVLMATSLETMWIQELDQFEGRKRRSVESTTGPKKKARQ